jgi:hypothetical protein
MDDRHRWECPVEVMELHDTYGWVPAEDKTRTLRVWDSQLGQLRGDFDKDLPWTKPYVYRIGAAIGVYDSGKEYVALSVANRYDMGQQKLDGMHDETGPSKPGATPLESEVADPDNDPRVLAERLKRAGGGEASVVPSNSSTSPPPPAEPHSGDTAVSLMEENIEPCKHENIRFAQRSDGASRDDSSEGFFCKDCGERVG